MPGNNQARIQALTVEILRNHMVTVLKGFGSDELVKIARILERIPHLDTAPRPLYEHDLSDLTGRQIALLERFLTAIGDESMIALSTLPQDKLSTFGKECLVAAWHLKEIRR